MTTIIQLYRKELLREGTRYREVCKLRGSAGGYAQHVNILNGAQLFAVCGLCVKTVATQGTNVMQVLPAETVGKDCACYGNATIIKT